MGTLIFGLTSIAPVNAGAAATNMKSNRAYASAQLLRLSNFPYGWQKSGQVWSGTSGDQNSSSVLTVTQYPQLSICLGMTPPLSVDAAEAGSLSFYSSDQLTNVSEAVDVYSNSADAKSDFPPFHNPKLAKCLLQIQGSSITNIEKSAWDSGTTFGTMTASVVNAPKFGNQSGMVMVQVPVNYSQADGGGSTIDFYAILVVRQGRSTTELFIWQTNVPPSSALTKSLAQTVTAKMKAPPPRNTIIAA
jgi:hypothetical protein